MPNFYIDRSTPIQFESQSITKREYFAAMAMQGILSSCFASMNPDYNDLALDALNFADALLSELDKTDSNE